ncbi:MAG: Rossmann fold domain-containing protein [Erythrobacter sp.]
MKRIAVDGLPDDPLAAAGVFHQHWLAHVEGILATGEDVMLVLPPADHAHREWRLAIVAGLARKHTPRRVNMVAGDGEGGAVAATETYLASAPGITGQYLET